MPDFEPLYTSDEMRAAEAGHDTSELMERAGAGAAELALQIYSGAERWTVVCGGGSNGGDDHMSRGPVGTTSICPLRIRERPLGFSGRWAPTTFQASS